MWNIYIYIYICVCVCVCVCVCLGREAYNVTESILDTGRLNVRKVQPDVYTRTPFISDNPLIYFGLNNNFQKIH